MLRSLGGRGTVLLLILCLSAAALAVWSWGLRRNVSELSGQLMRAEALWQERQKEKAPRVDPMAGMLRTLPTRAEINSEIFRLQDLAATHRVELGEADYGFSAAEPPLGGLVRVRFRTRSGYGELRDFLRAAHESLPALALARLSMERQRIADSRMEVSLEFVLYFRSTLP
ncbi:MAG: hypothetical protein PHU46_17130 [Rhodocyclaceae bacterium]|nr:hypothetical protein [Rhodocyclaceae bacterium]